MVQQVLHFEGNCIVIFKKSFDNLYFVYYVDLRIAGGNLLGKIFIILTY